MSHAQGERRTEIAIRRSPLGRVRGLGAAHAGVEHWRIERVTAFALIPLTVWFVIAALSMVGADQPVIAHWISRPWNAVLLLSLVVMTFHHTQLGMQVIYEDYLHVKWQQNMAIFATKAACLLLGLLAALSILRIALGPVG